MNRTNDKKYILQSVENALSIIDLLCEHQEMTTNEIAQFMKLGKSSVFRLLATLHYKGFVIKDSKSRYSLSLKYGSIWKIISERSTLIQQIHPYLVDLTTKTEETSHLVVWNNDHEIIFIDKVLASSTIRMDSMVGLVRQAHLTSTGKSLLANSSPDFIEHYLSVADFVKLTPTSITTKKDLLKELDDIRHQGYACDNEQAEVGLTCFSVPIFLMKQAIASISTSGPTFRMMEKKEMLITNLKEIAEKIEQSI